MYVYGIINYWNRVIICTCVFAHALFLGTSKYTYIVVLLYTVYKAYWGPRKQSTNLARVLWISRVSFRKMAKGGQNNTYEKKGGGQRECAR